MCRWDSWILIAIIEPLDVQGLKVSKFHVGNHIPFIKVKSSSWWPKTVTNKKSVVDETSSHPIHRFIGVFHEAKHIGERRNISSELNGALLLKNLPGPFFWREYDEMLWERRSLVMGSKFLERCFLQIHYRRVTRTALEASAQQPWMEFQPPKRDSWELPHWPMAKSSRMWPVARAVNRVMSRMMGQGLPPMKRVVRVDECLFEHDIGWHTRLMVDRTSIEHQLQFFLDCWWIQHW